MKWLMYLAIFIFVSGIVAVLGSVIVLPYTVEELVFGEGAVVWDSGTFLIHANSSESFVIPLNEVNISIVHVYASPSENVTLKIKPSPMQKPVCENVFYAMFKDTHDFFWTSPYQRNAYLFVFENNNPHQVTLNLTITEYIRGRDWRDKTYCNHLIDPNFVYVGLAAMVAGFVLTQKKRSEGEQDLRKELG